MKKISLLVMSCDNYEDVQKNFLNIWNKNIENWDSPIYLVVENRKPKYEGVNTLTPSKISWNDRLKYALDKIETKYILYMQEDYFVGNKINAKILYDIVDIMEENNLNYYKLDNYPKINNKLFNGKNLSLIPNNKRYGINLWTAIIKVSWLKSQLPKHPATAWEVEAHFLNNISAKFSGYLDGCVVDITEPLNIQYGVRGGQWWPKTIWYFKKRGIDINLSNRKVMPIAKMYYCELISFIAHILPAKVIRILKKILTFFGKKFISNN